MYKKLLLVVTLIFSACSFSSPEQNPCAEIQFSKTSSYPGEAISISGLPANATDVYADVTTNDNEEPSLGLVTVNADREFHLITPLHPDGITGGLVSVTIQADDISCPSQDFDILPLAPSPGAFHSYVDNLSNYLELSLQQYGVDRDVLLNGNLDDYPGVIFPLAVAQYMLDGPDNPNSLVKFADGTADVLDGTAMDEEILDAFTAHLELNNLIEEMASEERDNLAQQNNLQKTVSSSMMPLRQPSLGYISDAAELSEAMEKQEKCMRRITGLTGQLLNDADLASGVVGIFAPPLGTAIGLGLLIHKAPTEACAYLNPSGFASMRTEITKDSFEEDYDGSPGIVTGVWVTPKSEVWDVAGLLIDVAMTGAGKLDSLSDSAKLNRVGTGVVASPGTIPVNNIQTFNETMAPAFNNICSRREGCAEHQLKYEYDHNPWNEVNIYGEEWSDVKFAGGVLQGTEVYGEYLPKAVGTGHVEVWTEPDIFGSAAMRARAEVVVHEILVEITPPEARLKPGESQCFNATVSGAIDTGLDWYLTPQGGEAEYLKFTNDVNDEIDDYCFTAPDDIVLDPNPDKCEAPRPKSKFWVVKAVSLAETGLRENAEEERAGEALIRVTKTATNFVPPPECAETNACLLGKWELDNESYINFLKAISGTGTGEFTSATGQNFVEFDDEGNSTNSSKDFGLTLCSTEGCLTVPVQVSGTTPYYVVGDQLFIRGGGLTTATLGSFSENSEGTGADSKFSCQGNTLTIKQDGLPDVIWKRVSE